MIERSDAELVTLAQAGGREAFACLFARHAPMARRLCTRLLGTADGVEDVMQETALQAWLHIAGLRKPHQFGAWLAGIGLNVARHSLRGTGQAALSWEGLWGGRLVTEPLDRRPGPPELAEANELSHRVRAAVAELPRGQREAVLLVYLAGLSQREAAAALGIEIGAVKTRLHKGRGRLQRQLRDLWMEDLMSTPTTPVEQRSMVPMRVVDVRRSTDTDSGRDLSLVILEEIGGSRGLQIWVGRWEGDAISLLLEKVKVPRPLTHTLTASLLRAVGARVTQARILRLADTTFYAELALEGPAGTGSVDARPSDSIALALELDAPIIVADEVLTAAEKSIASEPSIGAGEIVTQLLENWPGPKATR